MAKLTYVVGDATNPQGDGQKVIVHCCNSIGAWGAGFVVPLAKKWPITKENYLSLHETRGLRLGYIQLVKVEDNLYVANLIGQEGTGRDYKGLPPVRYDAIYEGLRRLAISINNKGNVHTVHCPRFGAGLAGGDWKIIEAIVKSTLVDKGIDVTVYDLEPLEGTTYADDSTGSE